VPNKFKIGDKVVCITRNNWVPVGTVGIVAEDDNVPYVDWENGTHYCLIQDCMELVDDKDRPFKIGDRVYIATDVLEKSWKLPPGTVGTIIDFRSYGYTVHFDNWHHGHDGDHGYEDRSCLYVDENKLALFKEGMVKVNIVLFRQGNKVIAKLIWDKTILYTAEANCNPNDDFNFLLGSQIALQRLAEQVQEEDTVIAVPKDYTLEDLFVY
jgi:hypothetical protein